MNPLISVYIDDELSVEEKIEFVSAAHQDDEFKKDAIALLNQEKSLRMMLPQAFPTIAPQMRFSFRQWLRANLRPLHLTAVGLVLAGFMVMLVLGPLSSEKASCPNRFVIYQPSVEQVEIAGTFTQWRRIALSPIGQSGYWEIRLDVPPGEHRFSYILEGIRQIADPTIPYRESDDFGGQNSILRREGNA